MDNKIGELVRKLRTENKDTQGELGKKTGFSYGGIAKIERGERNATLDFLKKVAEVYNVPMTYFLGEKQQIPKELEGKVEWISFINEMEERNLTLDELKQLLTFLDKIKSK